MGVVALKQELRTMGYDHTAFDIKTGERLFFKVNEMIAKVIVTTEHGNELIVLDYCVQLVHALREEEDLPDLKKALDEVRKDCNYLVTKGAGFIHHKEIEA